jgi:hypothetical protein
MQLDIGCSHRYCTTDMSNLGSEAGLPTKQAKPTPAVPITLHLQSDTSAPIRERALWKLDGESDTFDEDAGYVRSTCLEWQSCMLTISGVMCAGTATRYDTRALKLCNELGVSNQAAEK